MFKCIEFHYSAAIKRNVQLQNSSWVCIQQLKVEKWRRHSCLPANSEPWIDIRQARNKIPAKPLWTLCCSTAVTLTYLTDRTKCNVFYIANPPPHPWVTFTDLSRVCCLRGTFSFVSVIKRDNVPIPSSLLPIYPVCYLSPPQHLVFKLILSVPHPPRLQ